MAFRLTLGIILGHFRQQSQATGLKAKTGVEGYGSLHKDVCSEATGDICIRELRVNTRRDYSNILVTQGHYFAIKN